MSEHSELSRAVIAGDLKTAEELARGALESGADAQDLVFQHLTPAMEEVGRRFEAGSFFLPELLIAARAMQGAMEILRPALLSEDRHFAGHVVLGTVRGDLHDIGKKLVGVLLEGAGFAVRDLGTDVSAAAFVEAARAPEVQVLGLSALLSSTMPAMVDVLGALGEAGLRPRVKVMVGGAPLTQEFADRIGADGFADNANAAVRLAARLAEASGAEGTA